MRIDTLPNNARFSRLSVFDIDSRKASQNESFVPLSLKDQRGSLEKI